MLRLVVALLVVAFVPMRAAGVSVQINRFDDPAPIPKQCTDRDHLDCSLRGAIDVVENDPGLDRTIHVPAGLYPLTQGLLLPFHGVKLVGSGATSTTIDALGLDRVLFVAFDETIEVSGLTLTRGNTGNGNDGAAIVNLGTLTLTDCIVRDSVSHRAGGGISNVHDGALGYQGDLTLVRTAFVGNVGAVGGGAIFNDGGTVTATDCVLDGNAGFLLIGGSGTIGSGGGILNHGVATLTGCTISRNVSGGGGGVASLDAGSVLTLVNSTVSGNSATASADGPGGGAYVGSGAALIFRSVTVTDNVGNTLGPGGIVAPAGGLTIQNSIVAGNHLMSGAASDCKGTISSAGFNLVGTTSNCTLTGGTNDVTGVDPLLAPLGDNGGATPTHALMVGSPAIEGGNPAQPGSGGGACPALDQRGIGRPQGTVCDIGAFEYAPPTTTTTSTTTTTLPIGAEICGDCIDNDGNGLTDLEDPTCCHAGAPVTLRPSRLAPGKGSAKLKLRGTLAGATLGPGSPATNDVFVQLRANGQPDFLCAHIPAPSLSRHGKKASFKDGKHEVASAGGIDAVSLKEKKGSIALRVIGTKLALPLPPAGTLEVTLGLRDPATAEAGNRCGTVLVPLKAKKGGLRFP